MGGDEDSKESDENNKLNGLCHSCLVFFMITPITRPYWL